MRLMDIPAKHAAYRFNMNSDTIIVFVHKTNVTETREAYFPCIVIDSSGNRRYSGWIWRKDGDLSNETECEEIEL